MNDFLEILKKPLRPAYWSLIRQPLFRRWRTSNYRSGKVALGEQNHYKIDRDWITVDVAGADFNVHIDEQTVLPFSNDSQAIVYSSHMIEHINEATLGRVLSECHRMLKPGGHIRLETPDAETALERYRSGDKEFIRYFQEENRRNIVERHGAPPVYLEDHIAVLGILSSYNVGETHFPAVASKEEFDAYARSGDLEAFGRWCIGLQTAEQQATHGHINVLYFDKLRRMLTDAGFKNVERAANRQTKIPGINITGIERTERAFFSFYVEASK